MDKIKVDTAYAIRLLEELVEETGPEFVYVNNDGESPEWDDIFGDCVNKVDCTYIHGERLYIEEGGVVVNNATPGCAIGRILLKLGVPVNVLVRENSTPFIDMVKFGWFEKMFEMSESAQLIFMKFQVSQDFGRPYGDTLKYVKSLYL